MSGDVDSNLLHDLNRFRPDPCRLCPGAFDFEAVAGIMPEDAFRHLAPGRICSAQNQNSLLSHFA
jgi:hypothetical protein